MALIQFVHNYDDLSTDKGYQFKFYCDKCGNGFISRFQMSAIGTAGSLLRAASNFLGGWVGSAGDSAYEVQRAVGGKAHDDALATAVQEGKTHFHQCARCGRWVCPEVCWNDASGQCKECAPDFQQELASSHAHAKAEAARQQLYEKAAATDFAAGIDMRGGSVVHSGAAPASSSRFCSNCGAALGSGKFCPECGTPAAQAKPMCGSCGYEPDRPVKFCPECGGKVA